MTCQRSFSIFVVMLFACLLASSSFAAEACYNEAQMRAEQLLRLHSELMVTTVTCKRTADGQPLGVYYGDFTKKNIALLHDAEQTMMDYYRAHRKGDPQAHLDRLRTLLANEWGQKSADMTAPEYCAAYIDRVVKFDNATHADIENEAEHMKLTMHSYAKECASASKKGG